MRFSLSPDSPRASVDLSYRRIWAEQEGEGAGFAQAFSAWSMEQSWEASWPPDPASATFPGFWMIVWFIRGKGVIMGEPSLDDSNVKVAVRVRPMNRRGEGGGGLLLI